MLAYAAWGSLLLGAALWGCGITFARATVSLILGAAVMLFALWFPGKIGMTGSPYVAGVIGFAVGAIVGGLGFRWVQAVTLAAMPGRGRGGVVLPMACAVATPAGNRDEYIAFGG